MFRQSSICSVLSEAAAWASATGLSLMLASPVRAMQGHDSLAGRWESEDGLFKVVALSDGRIASIDRRSCLPPNSAVKLGTFHLTGKTLCCDWLLSVPYDETINIDGDTMTLGDPAGLHWSYQRTAGESDAVRIYQTICDDLNRAANEQCKHAESGPIAAMNLNQNGIAAEQDPSQVGAFARCAADRSSQTPFVKAVVCS